MTPEQNDQKPAQPGQPQQASSPASTPNPEAPAAQPVSPYVTTPPPSKSKTGLIIGLVVGGLVLIAAIVVLVLALTVWGKDGDDEKKSTDTSQEESNKDDEKDEDDDKRSNNNAIAATGISSFETVCEGGSITNAAKYDKNAQSKIASFYESRTLATNSSKPNWTSTSAGYGEPYYADSKSFTEVSVVACLSYVEGSEQKELDCEYKSGETMVTVGYYSSKFKITYYEAATGDKIKDSETVNAPATKCPSFVSYNKTTLRAYASPDTGSLEAALVTFK